jgi:mitochondrial fission protein ELM1
MSGNKGAMQGESQPVQPTLAAASGWIISDGKAGHEAQALGVAEALGLRLEIKRVAPRGWRRALAPWAPVGARERFGQPGSAFAPPWPEVAIAIGRLTIPYLRALRRAAGLRTYTVVLLDPKTGPGTADLIWVPEHDARRGPNVITTLLPPHRFSPARLAELRAQPPPDFLVGEGEKLAVLLGGPNGDFRYTEATVARLLAVLASAQDLGARLLVTPSRRTPPGVVERVRALVSPRDFFWSGEGENPHPLFLAHADAFLVPADSISMTGEACVTGRPIYVFHPEGGSAKFARFHEALVARGLTRPCPERFARLGGWSAAPHYAAAAIAAEITRRWRRRAAALSGIVGPHGRS